MFYFNLKIGFIDMFRVLRLQNENKIVEFLIFFTFDDFLLIFLTNCFYRTVENFLKNMIIIEKIYVDNESSVIMLNSNATPRMAQRHYGSRDCRPLRELKQHI